jgi:hypothetical protein
MGFPEADTVTDNGRGARPAARRNDAKNCMHPLQFGPVFRPFIPCFRRFGSSPMTLDEALPTLSSLAAH